MKQVTFITGLFLRFVFAGLLISFSLNSSAAETEKQKYFVQVGSYESKEQAQSASKGLHGLSEDTYISSAEVKGVGKRWRLLLGDFDSKGSAQNKKDEWVKAKKISSSSLIVKFYSQEVEKIEEKKNPEPTHAHQAAQAPSCSKRSGPGKYNSKAYGYRATKT